MSTGFPSGAKAPLLLILRLYELEIISIHVRAWTSALQPVNHPSE
jgi:hypothetical protein